MGDKKTDAEANDCPTFSSSIFLSSMFFHLILNTSSNSIYTFYITFFILLGAILCHSQVSHSADYIVGPGDVLRITVFEHDNLGTTDRITENGFIIMPLLGPVKVGGSTIPEVSEKLSSLLADGYLVNPMVNIFVEEFRSQNTVVLGQVNTPGLIELSGPTNLLELLSKAGGLKEESGETATIKRTKNGKEEVIVVDLIMLFEGGDLANNITIQDEGGTANTYEKGVKILST